MTLTAKLHWQCRRGTKELDLLLQHYLRTGYSEATADEKILFTELLNLEDDQLCAYLLGEEQPNSKQLSSLISKIKKMLNFSVSLS